MPVPADIYQSYMRGWTCGAKSTALDERFTKHESSLIRQSYEVGWEAGVQARGAASKHATLLSGYMPSILRDEDKS